MMPIPIEWWQYFLTGKQTAQETYTWLTQVATKTWTSDRLQTAATVAKNWCRAACTQSDTDEDTCCVAVNVEPVQIDAAVVGWAIHSLARYLPKPKASPPLLPAPQAAHSTSDRQHITLLNHAISLAQDVIKANTERGDRERDSPKTLAEPLLCRLLGLSGLTWEEQDLLAPIWLQIRQQTDKTAKELVLQTFFQDLGKQLPAFKQFRNSTLFENILALKFEPGHTYETCHHGLSPLSVSMRSFAAQEKESQDDDYFDQATNKTPEAVRKHKTKMPPPLPATVGELLQLISRLLVLTVGLFTVHCSLAIQLTDLESELQEREQHIMGDPAAAAALIPQLTWAIISASREFYGTICTRADVDPPNGRGAKLAVAKLSIHTSMFSAGYNLNLTNVPDQWKPKPGLKSTAGQGSSGGNKSGQRDKRYGSDPFQQRNNKGDTEGGKGDNPNFPKALANGLKPIKEKFENIALSEIAKEAGIRGGPSGMDVSGLPARACLNWVCMGKCMRHICGFTHPDQVDEETAEALFKQLEPGVRRILETGKRPKFERE
jgi:hypothetical protein